MHTATTATTPAEKQAAAQCVAPAHSGDRSRSLQQLRRRLAHWELAHLRTLAADLHAQLEAVTAERDEAQRALDCAHSWGDSWQDIAMQLQHDLAEAGSPAAIGLTPQGQIGIVAERLV